MKSNRADYGLDAPAVVRNLLIIGGALLIVGLAAPVQRGFRHAAVWMGGSLFLTGVVMVLSSRVGKLRARDALLDAVELLPSDVVLDVGCGRGLLLIGAARRATQGRAVGIDLWSGRDQLGNSRAATIVNAVAEGVAARVEVLDGDMRALPFDNESFDAVVSSLAIHNLAAKEDRAKAVLEITRVLKPGGRVGIIDIANIASYAETLRTAGVMTKTGPALSHWIFPPARFVIATKRA